MAVKSFGKIIIERKSILITQAEPHISIKLKSIFPRIPKYDKPPYKLPLTDDVCYDLIWFMVRYPFTLVKEDLTKLYEGCNNYKAKQSKLEEIVNEKYEPIPVALKGTKTPRVYQLKGAEIIYTSKRVLIGDDIGLGKTLTSILCLVKPGTLPAAVVVETHMQKQWKDNIEEVTNLRVCLVKSPRPYPLPQADVYIFKYSQIAGWVNKFECGKYKYVIYDEVQNLRRSESEKYKGALALSEEAEFVTGLSATPVYNYGDEIFNVINVISKDALGERGLFIQEWCKEISMGKYKVSDPDALGSYLRERGLILRRTRKEVGRELPKVNTIVYPVEHDESLLKESHEISRVLAMKVLDQEITWQQRGQASLEFDLLVRKDTGVSKAKNVCALVRMIVESGEKVLLGGWHREVYQIWLKELADLNPVLYTGSESPAQKEASKQRFISGDSMVMIISNRSGAGLDGLQYVCWNVVHGELDWSPMVHKQLTGRVDRDGQKNPVTAYFATSDYGSDAPMVNVLGLKSSQSFGIMNPGEQTEVQYSDNSRIKMIAESFLNKKK